MVYKIRINHGTFETEKIVCFINNHSTIRKTLQEKHARVMESVIEQFCGGGVSLLILFTPPSMTTFSIVEKKLYLKHAIKFSL